VNSSEHQIRRSGARESAQLERLFIALFVLLLLCSAHPALAQTTETRRILAIRVSFPLETPDEETTSGDGNFDLRTFEEAEADYRFPFDIPPHNRSYFEAHLQGLAHYFNTVSNGKLTLAFDVLPSGQDASYQLERRLIDYGNGRTRQEINTRLVELFRDGILAADTQEGAALDFSEYDDIIVVHAGLGGESSNQLNDIASAFINSTDLNTYVEGPVLVDGGSHTINNGILLPEAGGTDGRSGLNGILARFYANQLGLPRLDNPEDGLPAIGDWSLMDTGNITVASSNQLGFANLNGSTTDTVLIAYAPSLLTAWSRATLGWLTPTVVRKDTTVSIAATHSLLDLPRAIRVPIAADEYFLIENRMSRLAVEGRRPSITLSEGTRGVWVANDDYDAFIPGSGILIWHIDEAVINASGENKPVNSNPDYRVHFDGLVGLYRKGVALEEADGLEDIGNTSASRVITSGIISFASISGNQQDPFYVGNNARFGPDTTPNSNNNLGYSSGIEIEILSVPGEVMDIAIRFTRHEDNWPQTVNAATGVAPKFLTLSGSPAILNGDLTQGANAWSVSGAAHMLDGFAALLTPATGTITQTVTQEILFSDGTSPSLFSEGRTISVSDVGGPMTASPSASPALGSFPNQNANDLWGFADGSVAWGIFGSSSGEASVGSAPVVALSVGDIDGDGRNELVSLNSNGLITATEGDGTTSTIGTVADVIGSPVVANLNAEGAEEIVVASSDGSVSIFSAEEQTVVSRPVSGGAASGPIVADLNRDGYGEVIFGGDGRIWVTRFNGVGQTDTPYAFPIKDRVGRIVATPLVADLDADGEQDIIVATQSGAIYAFMATGASLPGFPLLAAGPISVSPLLDDIDGDGHLEIVAFTDDGTAHLWHLERIDPSLTGTAVSWGQAGGNAGNTNRFAQTGSAIEQPSFTKLLPGPRAYCYPNPIRGNEAFIRYYLSEDADIDLQIVNAVGRIVAQVTDSQPVAGADNEIRWDTTDLGSGIFICRLRATTGSRTETRLIKTAIIR
jgi:M6 family metalloprotease-like protein